MENVLSTLQEKESILNFGIKETNIQKSINDTMKWYIGGAGVILILLKALDIFIK